MVKNQVRFNPEEREQCFACVNTGRAAAAKLLHARNLLEVDVGAGARHGTDAEMAEASDTSATAVHQVRQTFVEQGLEGASARSRPTALR